MKAIIIILIITLFPAINQSQHSIDPHSGKLELTVVDLSVPAGLLELQVVRSLQSQSDNEGILGPHWCLNWESMLMKGEGFVVMAEGEKFIYFSQLAEDVFSSDQGDRIVFDKDGNSICQLKGGTEHTFDSNGRLIKSLYSNDNLILYHYGNNGLIEKVEGPKGSYLNLVYDKEDRLIYIDASTNNKISYIHGPKGLTEVLLNGVSISRYDYDLENRLQSIDYLQSGIVRFRYDSKGRIISVQWENGDEDRYEYNDSVGTFKYISADNLVTTMRWIEDQSKEEIVDPLGNKTVTAYDSQGRVLSVNGSGGNETTFTYDDKGRISTMTACCGMITKYEYLSDSELIKSILFGDGSQQFFEYDTKNNLISITDGETVIVGKKYYPNGLLAAVSGQGIPGLRYTYYANGLLESETDDSGQITEYLYDDRGNLESIIDPGGGITSWSYDSLNRVVSEQDAEGGITRYEYDDKGHLNSQIDPNQGITRFEYDSRGRLVRETDPKGQTTRYYLNSQGLPLRIMDPSGHLWSFEYDANGNLVKEINPLGGMHLYNYDPSGKIVKATDPEGRQLEYQYSPAGLITKIIGPKGEVTSNDYDSQNMLAGVSDGAGKITKFKHNNKGRITQVEFPDGLIKYNSYNKSGRLIRESDNFGMDLKYKYNQLGQLIQKQRASGYTMSYKYDPLGNPIQMQDNLGHQWSTKYDKLGRVTQFNGASGQTEEYSYDKRGRLIEKTNILENTIQYTYTANGYLASVVEPTKEKTQYRYDASGNLSEIHHPAGGTTVINSDPLGNEINRINPLGQISKYSYDEAGRLIKSTDANKNVTTYNYDEIGLLSHQHYSDGKTINYTYDIIGELTELDDGQFPIKYFYNDKGQLEQIQYPVINKSLSYVYDDTGMLSKFTDSEGYEVNYEYDDINRLKGIKTFKKDLIEFNYDSKDRLTFITYPNGIKGAMEYNGDDLITHLKYSDEGGEVIAGWKFKYDLAGNLIEKADYNNEITRYHYDADERIIEESGPTRTIKYSYAPGGNRSKKETGSVINTYEYNVADHLLKAGIETFTYDDNGNMMTRRDSKGATSYQYDVRNRLTRVIKPDNSEIKFGYSPTGDRIWREDSSGRTWYVTDGNNLLAELDENLSPKAIYVHGPGLDQPLMMKKEGEQYYFHPDRLGSIAFLTDNDGDVAVSYDTDAFGILKSGDSKLNNPFIFTGREYDKDLDLYYYRSRYYDPGLGRFLTPDPADGSIIEPGNLNKYIYVGNNPTRFTDPLGLSKLPAPSLMQRLIYWRDNYGISIGQIMKRARGQQKFSTYLNEVKQVVYPRRYWTIEKGPTGLTQYNFDPYPHGAPSLQNAITKVESELLLSTGARPGVNLRSPSSILNSVDKNLGRNQTADWNSYVSKLPPKPLDNPAQPAAPAPKVVTWNRASAVLARARAKLEQDGAAKVVTARVPAADVNQALQTIVKPTPNPFKIHPGQGAAIAKGTAGVLSVTSILTNYEACIQEGKTPVQCTKETLSILAVAYPAGLLAKAAVTKILSAIGMSAAAPYVFAGAAMYGLKKSGDRWAEAPAVRQNKQWEKKRKEVQNKFNEIMVGLEKEVESLKDVRNRVKSEWEESLEAREKIIAEIQNCKDQMKEAEDYLLSLKRSLNKSDEAGVERDQKLEDIKAMGARAENLRQHVIVGKERVKTLAADIKSEDQANEIIKTYDKCKASASELVLLAEDAKAIRGKVMDVTKAVSNTKETYLFDIYERIEIGNSNVEMANKKMSLSTIRIYKENYERRRTSLIARIKMLRRFFSPDIELIKDKKERQNFGLFNKFRLRMKEIPPLTEVDINKLLGNEEYKECVKNARPMLLEIGTLEKELKNWKGEETVSAIEAAAKDALRALAGTDYLLQKAKDYLSRKRFISKPLNLTVHVQDENDNAIQGAKVIVQFVDGDELKKKRNELRNKILSGESTKEVREELQEISPQSMTTDAEGNVELTLRLGGDLNVEASAEGYSAASKIFNYDLTSHSLTLTLKPASFSGWWTGTFSGAEKISNPVPELELKTYKDLWTQFHFTSELLAKREEIENPGTLFWQWPSMSISISGSKLVIIGKNVFHDDWIGFSPPSSECDKKISTNMILTLNLKENGQVMEGRWRKDYCKADPRIYGKEHQVWAEGTIWLERGISIQNPKKKN